MQLNILNPEHFQVPASVFDEDKDLTLAEIGFIAAFCASKGLEQDFINPIGEANPEETNSIMKSLKNKGILTATLTDKKLSITLTL